MVNLLAVHAFYVVIIVAILILSRNSSSLAGEGVQMKKLDWTGKEAREAQTVHSS